MRDPEQMLNQLKVAGPAPEWKKRFGAELSGRVRGPTLWMGMRTCVNCALLLLLGWIWLVGPPRTSSLFSEPAGNSELESLGVLTPQQLRQQQILAQMTSERTIQHEIPQPNLPSQSDSSHTRTVPRRDLQPLALVHGRLSAKQGEPRIGNISWSQTTL